MATTELNYKGYTGSIEVSIEDKCLHGRVLFIDDLITYEGNTVEEVRTAFQNATDRYIAYCNKTGKPANKPYSGTLNVRIGSSRHRALAQMAYQEKISINEVICKAIDILQEPSKQVTVTPTYAAFYRRQTDDPMRQRESASASEYSQFDFEPKLSTYGNC